MPPISRATAGGRAAGGVTAYISATGVGALLVAVVNDKVVVVVDSDLAGDSRTDRVVRVRTSSVDVTQVSRVADSLAHVASTATSVVNGGRSGQAVVVGGVTGSGVTSSGVVVSSGAASAGALTVVVVDTDVVVVVDALLRVDVGADLVL